jgi:hypothetical protein
MFGNDRDSLRRQYVQAWALYRQDQPLDSLQQQIAQVLIDHPEYQTLVETEASLEREYLPEFGETNPFLHMGLHLAVRDQVKTDRPAGIREAYQKLLMDHGGEAHEVEHSIIDCLAESLWQAQRDQVAPDEASYLLCVKLLTQSPQKK